MKKNGDKELFDNITLLNNEKKVFCVDLSLKKRYNKNMLFENNNN